MGDMIAESLLVQVDHGEGLLLRLYRLQKDLSNEQSHLGFIHRERPFPSLFKNVSNLNSKALQTYKLSGKYHEELSGISDKICELLSPTLNVIQDCFDYVQSTRSLFKLIGDFSLNFDPSTAPDMTKLFLELCSTLIRVLILASRIGPLVKLIIVSVKGCSVRSGDYKITAELCDFVAGALSKPLVFAYELATPCRNSLKTALLSPLCMCLVKQRSSRDQWAKEEFLCLRGAVMGTCGGDEGEQDGTMGVTTSMGYQQPGIDVAHLESLERWFFFGLILCHDVVDVTKRDSGEFRVWAMILQGIWVIPIFRDEVLWVHDELTTFFKSLKGGKSHGLSKKAQEVKALKVTALRSAPMYRQHRRMYLASLLGHYKSMLQSEPALMLGPKSLHLTKLLSLCKAEINWMLQHHSNIPTKKQELALLEQDGGIRSLSFSSKGCELVSLVGQVQEVRRLATRGHQAWKEPQLQYLKGLIAGFDLPSCLESLSEEVARINDPHISNHPMNKALESIKIAHDKMIQDAEDGGQRTIQSDLVNLSFVRALKLDLLRLQSATMTSTASDDPTRQVSIRRPANLDLAVRVDSALAHLDMLIAAIFGDGEVPHSEDDVVIRRALSSCAGFSCSSDLSLLPLARPNLLRALLNHSLDFQSSDLTDALISSPVAICELWSHPKLARQRHGHSAEDAAEWRKRCAEGANTFIKLVCKRIMRHFRTWAEFHFGVTKTAMASHDENAVKVALQIASRRAKATKGGDSTAALERIVKLQTVKKKEEDNNNNNSQNMEMVFARMVGMCRALAERKEIAVGAFSFSTREYLLQSLSSEFIPFLVPYLNLKDATPSFLQARIQEFIWCANSLLQNVSGIDASQFCSKLLSDLRQSVEVEEGGEEGVFGASNKSGSPSSSSSSNLERALGRQQSSSSAASKQALVVLSRYLEEYFQNVVKPTVCGGRNLLLFSKTFGNFVLAPKQLLSHYISSDNQNTSKHIFNQSESEKLSAERLEVLLSPSEMSALAEILGALGVRTLIEDYIYKLGVIPELRSLHIAMANIRNKKHSEAANSDTNGVKVDAGRILLHWQKIGSYLCICHLLQTGLEEQSSVKMPYMFNAVAIANNSSNNNVMDLTTTNVGLTPKSSTGFLCPALSALLNNDEDDDLVWCEDLLRKLITATAAALSEGAVQFKSSVYLGEVPVGNNGTTMICLDSHLNSLGCVALAIPKVITTIMHSIKSNQNSGNDDNLDDNDDDDVIGDFLSLLGDRLRTCRSLDEADKILRSSLIIFLDNLAQACNVGNGSLLSTNLSTLLAHHRQLDLANGGKDVTRKIKTFLNSEVKHMRAEVEAKAVLVDL